MARTLVGEREHGIAVRIMSRELVKDAEVYAKAESRSIGRQIEYWAKVGKLALQNPQLSVKMICGTLLGLEQEKAGQVYKVDLPGIAAGRKGAKL